MDTCLCLRGTSTPSSKVHPKSKAAISKYETDSTPFGFFCVINDTFTSRINYDIQRMSLRSPITPTHNPPQPSTDTPMNSMYAGSPGISSTKFVGSKDVSCISCRIMPTNFLTAVDISRFNHDGYRNSTKFTSVNIPFTSGMPIFVWWNFLIAELNVFEIYSHPAAY